MKPAICRLRVSTASKTKRGCEATYDQNPEVQEQPLREWALQRGWTLHQVYSDRPSGTRERRPSLDALMTDTRRRLFVVIAVWRFDRFARSVKQLVLALEEFRALGLNLCPTRKPWTAARRWLRQCSRLPLRWLNWIGASSASA